MIVKKVLMMIIKRRDGDDNKERRWWWWLSQADHGEDERQGSIRLESQLRFTWDVRQYAAFQQGEWKVPRPKKCGEIIEELRWLSEIPENHASMDIPVMFSLSQDQESKTTQESSKTPQIEQRQGLKNISLTTSALLMHVGYAAFEVVHNRISCEVVSAKREAVIFAAKRDQLQHCSRTEPHFLRYTRHRHPYLDDFLISCRWNKPVSSRSIDLSGMIRSSVS